MKRFMAMAGVICLWAGVAVLGWTAPSRAAQFEFTFSQFMPATHMQSKLCESWCAEVKKRTNGRVKIQYFPGQSLTKAKQSYDGVVKGLSDMAMGLLQYTRGRFPLMEFINLPLGYPDALVATAILNEVVEKFKPKELDDTKILYLTAHGPGVISTKGKMIRTMADMKGLKIRSHGTTAKMVQALGGTPVALPMPELYQALQKGIVQGGVFPLSSLYDWRLSEVTDYTTVVIPIAYSLGFFNVMNKDEWNALPKDIQKIIEDINAEWMIKHAQARVEDEAFGAMYGLRKGNCLIGVNPDATKNWVEAVQPVIDNYIKETKAKGLPGDAVVAYVKKRLEDEEQGRFKSKYLPDAK